jgi:c-di-GMP-binding flagellar brake protein YcgR
MSEEDKRQFKRFSIQGKDVHCKMHVATDVRLLNISLSGGSIRLHRRLNMGSRYHFHIEAGNGKITLNCVVVWEKMVASQKNEKGDMLPVYEVGIKFDEVLSDKGNEVIQFIENNLSQEEFRARVRGLRVEIIKPDKTVISDQLGNYNVIKISQSGILIDSDYKLDVESKFTMELSLPEERGSVKFMGRVASCSETHEADSRGYETGIEFLEMSNTDKSKIQEFIESIGDIGRVR